MVDQAETQQTEAFFQVILARIVGLYPKYDGKFRSSEIGPAYVMAKGRLVDHDIVVTSKSKPW